MALEGALPHHYSSGTDVVRFGSTSSGGIRLVGGSWQGFYSGSSKMRYLFVKCCGQSLRERERKTINPFFLHIDLNLILPHNLGIAFSEVWSVMMST